MTSSPQPLRLLLVTPRYFPFTGGIETHVYEVARRLVARGQHVTVLTTDPRGELPAVEEQAGVHIQRVRAWPARRDYYLAPGVYQTIARGAWDVVHCQGIHTFVPPLAMLAARRADVPFVVSFHTGGHSSRLRHAIRGAQWRALRPLLARADRLIGVSRFETALFQRALGLPASRFATVPNGAELPQLPAGAPPSEDPALIISIGRLEQYKGHHRLIDALPLVRARVPDAHLLILGAGPYEAALRERAARLGVADKVEITAIPAGDRSAMAATLARAGLVALLSEYEAHPIAVMEAVALGRRVLVADTSGLSELAERGLVTALPLHSAPATVAAAITGALDRPAPALRPDVLSWDDCTALLLDIYRRVTARRLACAS